MELLDAERLEAIVQQDIRFHEAKRMSWALGKPELIKEEYDAWRDGLHVTPRLPRERLEAAVLAIMRRQADRQAKTGAN